MRGQGAQLGSSRAESFISSPTQAKASAISDGIVRTVGASIEGISALAQETVTATWITLALKDCDLFRPAPAERSPVL
jgi:hypothetical protein